MTRSGLFDLMGRSGLRGMKAARDETLTAERRRSRGPEWLVGELLRAGPADKTARSIKYRMTIARLPDAKELSEFDFGACPVDEAAVRSLADGSFIEACRNAVLIGGTGTGKSHIAWRSHAPASGAGQGDASSTSSNLPTCSNGNSGTGDRDDWPKPCEGATS